VQETGTGSFVAGSGQGLTLALDTALDDELLAEGLCREIINKVQNLRKKSGLEVSDRIELGIEGPQSVLQVVGNYSDRIMADTLAVGVASTGEMPYKESFSIDDVEITIALGKV
jgi:isoleucyl-tRNA synthetase